MRKLLCNLFLLVLVVTLCTERITAQTGLARKELQLKQLFDRLGQASTDSIKFALNAQIREEIKDAIQSDSSFVYPFEGIRYLGKITSPDNKVRLYNWNLVLEDGSYRYYAFLQMKKGKKGVQTFELKEKKYSAKEVMTRSLGPDNWMGALYYQVLPFQSKRKKYYMLLGWDGNNFRTNRKLIEILHIDSNEGVQFGSPLILWRGKRLQRVVFEYAKQARMSLQYDVQKDRVVFDHLSPSSPRYQGQYEYYGPDFSHDALVFEKGIWKLVENVDVRNTVKKK